MLSPNKIYFGLLSRILVRSLDADCTIPLAVYWKDILAHEVCAMGQFLLENGVRAGILAKYCLPIARESAHPIGISYANASQL